MSRDKASIPLHGMIIGIALLIPQAALADEGGVSFWVPGFFGSLAAAPQQPGWSLATIYYHTSVSGGADVALEREFETARIPANLTVRLNTSLSLSGTGDLGFVIPSYVFATPVLGGQAAAALVGAYGRTSTSVGGTLSGTLATPLGSIAFMRSDTISDTVWGFSDLIPQFSLRWNAGVNNFMTYITGDIPVGAYDSTRLANMGIGHGAIDAGGGYTYFNPQTGHEFSAVGGFTYNFVNTATDYQNGIDFHVDMAASQFLSKQLFIGPVAYVYQEVTTDSGSAPILGPVQSRVFGVGPQLGYLFPVGNMQGYLNAKAYFEFDSHDRASGWNTWLTFSISPPAPPAPTPPPSRAPMIYK
jgi:hypothetical protein